MLLASESYTAILTSLELIQSVPFYTFLEKVLNSSESMLLEDTLTYFIFL